MKQLQMVDEITPEDWIARAKDQWSPVKTFCLFSGGGDSSVVAHRLRDHYEALVFIDTGTAAKGVREHVEFFADWIGKPLIVEEAGSAYRDMVLGGRILSRGENEGKPEPAMGFPGKGQHGKAYTRLKERQIEKVLAKAKEGHPRTASILFLSGVRRDESAPSHEPDAVDGAWQREVREPADRVDEPGDARLPGQSRTAAVRGICPASPLRGM